MEDVIFGDITQELIGDNQLEKIQDKGNKAVVLLLRHMKAKGKRATVGDLWDLELFWSIMACIYVQNQEFHINNQNNVLTN